MDKRPLCSVQHELVCPVCKSALEFVPGLIRCISCGLRFIQSRSDCFDLLPQHLLKGGISHWTERQHQMEEWYRDLIGIPGQAFAIFENDYAPYASVLSALSGTVLDLGGGNGIARHYLPRSIEYICIDPSFAWLEIDWSSLTEHFPCLRAIPCFVRGIGEHLPFPPGRFDAVLAFWSLNHVNDPERVFREVYRVLRPGGRFLAVLEDMVPNWRDILTWTIPGGPVHARGLLCADSRRYLRRHFLHQDRSLQSDHIRVYESDIRMWISGRFTVARRIFGEYLSLEFRRKGCSNRESCFV